MSTEKKERSFRIVAISGDDGINFDQGVYHGRGPGQAALKAFNWYCRKAKLNNCVRRFTIEEITRGSNRKHFHYIGRRKIREQAKEIEREGKEYKIMHETTVHKAKAPSV